MADALQYLHSRSIVYRDLKPDNVLVLKYPLPEKQWTTDFCVFVKLADYGISKQVSPQGIRGIEGTRPYLPPEVILHGGREAYSTKLDVYAFGMFMYYLITFMTPFENDATRPITAMLEDGKRPSLSAKVRSNLSMCDIGSYFVLFLLLTGKCYKAEISTIPFPLRCAFVWYAFFLPKSKFSVSGRKPWTIVRRFD